MGLHTIAVGKRCAMHTLHHLKFVHQFRTSFALAFITVSMISLMKKAGIDAQKNQYLLMLQ
jgi:hypothetical protein